MKHSKRIQYIEEHNLLGAEFADILAKFGSPADVEKKQWDPDIVVSNHIWRKPLSDKQQCTISVYKGIIVGTEIRYDPSWTHSWRMSCEDIRADIGAIFCSKQ